MNEQRPPSPTAEGLDTEALAYSASLEIDRRLYKYDILGSVSHARMLAKQKIIAEGEAAAIVQGLEEIRVEIERGTFPWRTELEDLHMNIEARLKEKIGDAAGKLHTARSRNDQVATDVRLYVKDTSGKVLESLKGLQSAILDIAEEHQETIMPGYTHLQRAQPVLLAHHLLAYFEMFHRDRLRFRGGLERTDALPLGSAALAGAAYALDREFVARELGFSRLSENSLDAVADRDFVAEFQADAAICMMHISRLSEELIIWSSSEFSYLQFGPSFSTGSSIMPQKRNPDVAELARARSGRVYGNLIAILTVLKSLPLAYNRDLQEDKAGLFDTADTLLSTIDIVAKFLPALRFNVHRMRQAAEESYSLATDLADYLVGKGLPFRDAHQAVAALVSESQKSGKELADLSLGDYQRFSPLFEKDVLEVSVETSLASRDVFGGTAPRRVEAALKRARQRLAGDGA